MNTITLPTDIIKAFLLFAGKKDIRYFLNGVLVRSKEQGIELAASNGHILLTLHLKHTPPISDKEIIIPRDKIELAIKDKSNKTNITINSSSIGGVLYTPIDKKYPDFTKQLAIDYTDLPEYRHYNFRFDYADSAIKAISLIISTSSLKTVVSRTPLFSTNNGLTQGNLLYRIDHDDMAINALIMPLRD